MGTPDAELAVEVSPWVRSAWVAAYALLLLALVWVALTWAHIRVVVGTTVVPLWVAGPALVLAGTLVRACLRALGVPKPGHHRVRWELVMSALTVCAWVAVPLAALLDAYDDPTYTVLQSAEPGGCRLVVEEESFLLAGSGTVYVSSGWGPFVTRMGSYSTDDGYRPVSTGSYSLQWNHRSGGVLDVGPTLEGGDDEGGSGRFDFAC